MYNLCSEKNMVALRALFELSIASAITREIILHENTLLDYRFPKCINVQFPIYELNQLKLFEKAKYYIYLGNSDDLDDSNEYNF